MSNPAWDEFARLQHHAAPPDTTATKPLLLADDLVSEERLDAFLIRYMDEEQPFELHDCRRWLKNLSRNRARKWRERDALLASEGPCLASRAAEAPLAALVCEEEWTLMRRNITADDWNLLIDTSDGDYAGAAERAGMAVGTVKSRVSRCKRHLHEVLSPDSRQA
jgi:DNA-directed RNA polymerase specialized sigma24 family protein